MESTRQKKIAALIQKEMSIIFQRNSGEYLKKMITVTIVRVTPDLSSAKLYVSIFPEQQKDEVYDLIVGSASKLRYELGNRIRNQVRKIPDLHVFIDDSLDYAENIDNLLKQ